MLLINRLSDNLIIHYVQRADWRWYQKLADLQNQYNNLPGNTSQEVKDAMLASIAALETDRDAWYERFQINAGVNPETHGIVHVPENEIPQALTARYITYDGTDLTYHGNSVYSIVGSAITVFAGWMKGDERLLMDDVTDFGSLALTEPLYFKLVPCQNNATSEITIQLLTRNEDEEFDAVPGNLTVLNTPLPQGRVNLDNSITEGVF